MDLTFTEEQQLLKQSAERYLQQRYGFAERQRYAADSKGWDSKVWSDFAQFGWLALPFEVDNGGLGAGAIELALLGKAFGGALVVEPYSPSIVLSGFLLERLLHRIQNPAAQHAPAQARLATPITERIARLINGLITGKHTVTLAHEESASRIVAAPISAIARRSNDNWMISGTKAMVRAADSADSFLVSAKLENASGPAGLFVVPARAAGLSLSTCGLIDGTHASDLQLVQVAVGVEDHLSALEPSSEELSASEPSAITNPQANNFDPVNDLIHRALNRAMVFAAAETSGSMQAVLDATVAYTKTRQQFGKPLAANQVIKHRLVDMAIACEEASAIALRAALIGDAASARAAKIKVSRAARFVGEQSIQLHGGMGVTEELNVGAYFKKLLAFEMSFGAAKHHAQVQFGTLRNRVLGKAA